MIYRRPPKHINGWMSQAELQWLYSRAKEYKTIIEVGCWQGKSTHALLTGALKGGGKVSVVDHFQGAAGQERFFLDVAYMDIYHVFQAHVGHFPNLDIIYKMPSLEGAARAETAEMVFIDAGHDYEEVKADIEAWQPKCTKLLCGHDYYVFPGVKKAVMEKFGVPRICDSIWYVEMPHDPH